MTSTPSTRTAPAPDPFETSHRPSGIAIVADLRRVRWIRHCQPMRPWR